MVSTSMLATFLAFVATSSAISACTAVVGKHSRCQPSRPFVRSFLHGRQSIIREPSCQKDQDDIERTCDVEFSSLHTVFYQTPWSKLPKQTPKLFFGIHCTVQTCVCVCVCVLPNYQSSVSRQCSISLRVKMELCLVVAATTTFVPFKSWQASSCLPRKWTPASLTLPSSGYFLLVILISFSF